MCWISNVIQHKNFLRVLVKCRIPLVIQIPLFWDKVERFTIAKTYPDNYNADGPQSIFSKTYRRTKACVKQLTKNFCVTQYTC